MPENGYAGRRRNGAALTLIIAGHAAALTALALYRMDLPQPPSNRGIVTENIPLDVPPPPIDPPPPERTAETPPPQDRSVITSVPPVIPVPSQGPVVEPTQFDDIVTLAPAGETETTGPKTVPFTPPVTESVIQPRLKPVGAKPRGNPSAWVTNDDYPDSALRNEDQGRTAFRLAIGVDGRPASCTVTASSGARALDEAACRLLMRRARFTAARDSEGAAIAGTYTNSFLWQIPED